MKTITRPTEATTSTNRVLALLDVDEPAKVVIVGREPDLYDDEQAIWIGETCVVAVDIQRMHAIHEVLATADHFQSITKPNSTGWARLSPSHYGIEVMEFDGDVPTAQDAWTIAKEVTR